MWELNIELAAWHSFVALIGMAWGNFEDENLQWFRERVEEEEMQGIWRHKNVFFFFFIFFNHSFLSNMVAVLIGKEEYT